MSFENSSVMVEGPEATLKALSELTAGATLLKAGRSVRNLKKFSSVVGTLGYNVPSITLSIGLFHLVVIHPHGRPIISSEGSKLMPF